MADKKISELEQITTYDSTTMIPVSTWDGYKYVNKKIAVEDIANTTTGSTTGATALNVVKNYGLTNKIVIINEIQPNTLYIYDASVVSSLTISAKASGWGDSSISHIKFTSDSTISIIYTSDIFIKFNSDTTPQSNKVHEISLFGNDAILAVKD